MNINRYTCMIETMSLNTELLSWKENKTYNKKIYEICIDCLFLES